jgi:hypothetical protein
MARARISREELTEKVLAAVRGEPGCNGVREISISEMKVLDEGSSWRVTVIDEGDAKRDVASHAAQRVEDVLNLHYELI